MKRVIFILTAIILLMSNVTAFGEDIGEQTEGHELIEDMILYYGCYGEAATEEIDDLIGALKEVDSRKGKLWADIMDYWGYIDTDITINMERLPENLP